MTYDDSFERSAASRVTAPFPKELLRDDGIPPVVVARWRGWWQRRVRRQLECVEQWLIEHFLRHGANEDGTSYWGTMKLAQKFGVCKRTLLAYRQRLVDDGMIKVLTRTEKVAKGISPHKAAVRVLDWPQWIESPESSKLPEPPKLREVGANSDSNSNPKRMSSAPSVVTQPPRHSNARNAGKVGNDIEMLRAELDVADDDTREQGYACLAVGVHVCMTRWLITEHPRGKRWIKGVLARALKARRPAGFLIAAICQGYSHVSDTDTQKRHRYAMKARAASPHTRLASWPVNPPTVPVRQHSAEARTSPPTPILAPEEHLRMVRASLSQANPEWARKHVQRAS